MDFPGKRALFNFILSLMVVPPVVMMVPMFISMVQWKMVNTHHGVILIYVGLLLPFSIYLMTNFFQTIPSEILDAARIDGCSNFGIFWQILMPCRPRPSPPWWSSSLVGLERTDDVWFSCRKMIKTPIGNAALRSRNYVDIPATMAGLLSRPSPLWFFIYLVKYFIRGLVSAL
jgi:ABC-type glycerol-3-phosphate transport system permease component